MARTCTGKVSAYVLSGRLLRDLGGVEVWAVSSFDLLKRLTNEAGPPKIERQLFGGSSPSLPRPSAKWNRSHSGLPGSAVRAAANHECSIEQWFGTMSTRTLRSSRCAS